jgi:hypothetical protein
VPLARFQRCADGTLRWFHTAADRDWTDAIPVVIEDVNLLGFSEASRSLVARQLSRDCSSKWLSLNVRLTRADICELRCRARTAANFVNAERTSVLIF